MNKTIYNLLIIASLAGLITAGLLIDNSEKMGGKTEPILTADQMAVKSIAESISAKETSISSESLGYRKYVAEEETIEANTGIKYRVDEYVVWDGRETPKETGYIIHYEKPDGSKMATGTGEYAKTLSHDWTAPKAESMTVSTSTFE